MARYPIKNFKPDGYYGRGFYELVEVQIDNNGELARYRITQRFVHQDVVFFGHWQEIRYTKRGRAYINDWSNYPKTKSHKRLYLDRVIRYYKK